MLRVLDVVTAFGAVRPAAGVRGSLVFSVAGSLLAFDQFFIMTNGGPSNSTITAVYAIYRNSFISFKLGYGAALSVFLMVILAAVSAVQMLLLRNTDHD